MSIVVPQSAPLWLELKTEYIDQNFENVLKYLYDGSKDISKNDTFYFRTCKLLSDRVDILLDKLDVSEVYSTGEDVKFAARLIGAYLLVSSDIDVLKRRKCDVAFLLCLSIEVCKESEALLKLALDILSGKRSNLLYINWQDIMDFNPSVITYKLLKPTNASGNSDTVRYSGKGTVVIGTEGLSLFCSAGGDSDVKALSLLENRIHIMAAKDDRIKQSEYDDIEKLYQFTGDYIQTIRNFTVRPRNRYTDDSVALVKILGYKDDKIIVESVDPRYEKFTGIVAVPKFLGYTIQDFINFMVIGSYIEVTIKSVVDKTCDLLDCLAHYIVDDVAKNDMGEIVLAYKLYDLTDKKGAHRTAWLTDGGYVAMTSGLCNCTDGTFADIKIVNHGKEQFYAYINAAFVTTAEDSFDVNQVRKAFIEGFAKDKSLIDGIGNADTGVLSMICKMMILYYRSLSKPSEKYLALCAARILSEFLGKESDSEYIYFLQNYLGNLIHFVNDDMEKMSVPVPAVGIANLDIVSRKLFILKILNGYGNNQMNQFLDEVISSGKDCMIVKIASLVQSCNRLGNIVNKSVKNAVKSEIISSLSLEMEGEMDLEKETGKYLGMENEHQEFKTSFFYAPSGAKEQNQKNTIFKGICAFLNSDTGGILYLGVNDMGYVKGLDADFEYMERTYCGVYSGMDGYVRCIIDEAKKYFDSGMLQCIRVSPEYDGKVVAIMVKPYPYGVAVVDAKAFVRLNNETVVMSDRAKERLLEKRISQDNEDVRTIGTIQDAINKKCLAVFHGYSSSNSGNKSERNVEPFYIYPGLKYVCCYDVDESEVRVFRMDRIGNVEVTKIPWKYEKMHVKQKMDVFHMTGDNSVHVILQMDMMAKNLLCEEYPDAALCVKKYDKDSEYWIFEADVYSLEGIGRFYMGLAGRITILDAPGLAEFAREYASKYLLG